MSYQPEFLETRAVIKHGQYAVIPPETRKKNVIPGFKDVDFYILASPKLGAKSTFYTATVMPGGKTTQPYQQEGIEVFLYVHQCKAALDVKVGSQTCALTQGGYAFVPEGTPFEFINNTEEAITIFLYRKRYERIAGHEAEIVISNIHDVKEIENGVDNVFYRDLLPDHLGFDVSILTLSFEPDGRHSGCETHVQEHCAYVISGQGFYLLGEDWVQVKDEDFIWMGPFTQQGAYATGRTRFTYIYSKECNREEAL